MTIASIEVGRVPHRLGAWTLQGVVAAAFFVAGIAKLAGAPFMVQLFAQIGIGQWLRAVTGVVEIIGAFALVFPGLASIGGLWLGATMVGALAANLFILHTNPVPAVILGSLSALIVYLHCDELQALAASITE
jgi:putative oxidoreductase